MQPSLVAPYLVVKKASYSQKPHWQLGGRQKSVGRCHFRRSSNSRVTVANCQVKPLISYREKIARTRENVPWIGIESV